MIKEDTQKWAKTFLLSASILGFAFFFYGFVQVIGMILIPLIIKNHSETLIKLIQLLDIDPTALSHSLGGFLQYLSLLISKTIVMIIASVIFWITCKKSQKSKWLKFLCLILAAGLMGRSGYGTIIGLLGLIGSLLLIYEEMRVSKS